MASCIGFPLARTGSAAENLTGSRFQIVPSVGSLNAQGAKGKMKRAKKAISFYALMLGLSLFLSLGAVVWKIVVGEFLYGWEGPAEWEPSPYRLNSGIALLWASAIVAMFA